MAWRTWETAWQEALYGPAGFYRRAEGPAGHFATSAQGMPGVGRWLAEAVATLAARHGLRHVVDLGAGRGELLGHLAQVAPSLRLTGVDVGSRPEHLHPRAGWLVGSGGAQLPAALDGLTGVLVLAHEWLDVVPCPVAQLGDDGVWRAVEVDAAGSERLGGALPAADVAWLQRWWPVPGTSPPGDPDAGPAGWPRAEVGRTRDAAWVGLLSRVGDGLVLAVDYGHTRARRPAWGSLTAYRDGVQVPPVPDGTCDLTAHVAVDSLGADRLVRQHEAVADLLGPDRPVPHGLAATDPAGYLARLGRRSARALLGDPRGPGGFWWALTGRGSVRLD